MFVYLLFFSITLLYFHPMLSCKNLFVERDLSAFFIPPKYLWVKLIGQGEFPLWNPYNYSGIPLLAALQPGVLYPPHIFYLFLPFNVVWNWLIILHFVLSGITMYIFLRYLKASALASFIGGIILVLSGYMMSIHSLLTHLFSVPWFPLITMYFLKYLNDKKNKYLLLCTFYLTMQFLAGAPEIVMMTLFVIFIFAIFPSIFINEKTTHSFGIKAVLLTVLIFLLLSSIQLLPFIELKSFSIRSAGLSYQEATTWSFDWKDFIQFILPDAFGYFQTTEKYWSNQSWLKTVYLGIIPLVLSMFYFMSKDKRKWVFLLFIIVSFMIALGRNTLLYNLLYHIPPFNSMRYPVKYLFLFFMVISITSALGFDKLMEGVEKKDRSTKVFISIIFYIGFLFAALWGYVNFFESEIHLFLERNGYTPNAYNDIKFNLHNIKRFLLFSFIFCTILFFYLGLKRHKRIALYAMPFVLIADLFLANYSFYYPVSWDWYMSRNDFIEILSKNKQTDRYFTTKKTSKEFEHFPYDRATLSPAYASIFSLYTIWGAEVMRVSHHDILLNMLLNSASVHDGKKVFDFSGIRYVITSYKMDDKDLRLIRELPVNEKKAYLYEYTRFPGRFLLFNNEVYAKDTNAAFEKLTDKNIDLRSTLILIDSEKGQNTPSIALSPNQKNTSFEDIKGGLLGKATPVLYKANKVVIECDATTDAFLYVSDTFYPGWRAYVDGKSTKIYQANLAFRAVKIPKGIHRVEFRYIPFSFYLGLMLTIFGVVVCIWLIKRDRKDKNENV